MKNIVFLLLFTLPCIISAQIDYSLKAHQPGGNTQGASIDEAIISVRPSGIYWEFGLYLTFSAKGSQFTPSDSLEVIFRFKLPEEYILHDTWLWIGSDIIKARMVDRWSTSIINENVESRLPNSAVLHKTSPSDYELRIFPMAGNSTRKVKLTWLASPDWTDEKVMAPLPTILLEASSIKLPKATLQVWPDTDWDNPMLIIYETVEWTQKVTPAGETFYQTEIPRLSYLSQPILQFKSPLQNGSYMRYFETGENEGYYQMAVLPRVDYVPPQPKKILVLLDRQEHFNDNFMNFDFMIKLLGQAMQDRLYPTDSFNIIYSGTVNKKVSDHWLPLTDDAITSAFSAVNVATVSNLGELLFDGIDYARENNNNASIFLISNGVQYFPLEWATVLHDSLLSYMGNGYKPPVHTMDYRVNNTPSNFVNGVLYHGNDYLYYLLAQSTNGSWHSVRNNDVFEAAALTCSSINGQYSSLDVHTTAAEGFCFGRYDLGNGAPFLYRPLLQCGRYYGKMPLKVEIISELNTDLFVQNTTIEPRPSQLSDSLCVELWNGKRILEIEKNPLNNLQAVDLIQNSIEQHVLSRFTSLLCLEDPTLVCNDCVDESLFSTSTDDPDSPTDSLLTAYPNPFSSAVSITIHQELLPENSRYFTVDIYNVGGQLVKQFETLSGGNGPIQLRWDGTNNGGYHISGGVYLLRAHAGNWSGMLKLVKQ